MVLESCWLYLEMLTCHLYYPLPLAKMSLVQNSFIQCVSEIFLYDRYLSSVWFWSNVMVSITSFVVQVHVLFYPFLDLVFHTQCNNETCCWIQTIQLCHKSACRITNICNNMNNSISFYITEIVDWFVIFKFLIFPCYHSFRNRFSLFSIPFWIWIFSFIWVKPVEIEPSHSF